MKLLTQALRKQLPALYTQQNEADPMVICKFFHPMSSMTWYAIEGSPVDEDGYYDTDKEKVDFLFFGWVYSDFPELGYFSLSEMESVKVMGLGIERDLHFTPKKLSEVKRSVKHCKQALCRNGGRPQQQSTCSFTEAPHRYFTTYGTSLAGVACERRKEKAVFPQLGTVSTTV